MKKDLVLGVDLGGTKIVSGIINCSGEVIGSPKRVSTLAEEPAEAIIGRMIETINRTLEDAGLSSSALVGIGIGSPGPLDVKNGIILNTGNLPTLHNYKLRDKLENTFNTPVLMNNDANCFALGEACFGAVKNAGNAVGITLGTGFGCGLIIDGKIYSGSTGTAAEIDMCPYLDGNLEDYISGRGVTRIYKKITGKKSQPPSIAEMAGNNDADSIKTWEEFGRHLGFALAYVVNILDPEVIIIGGSLSNAYEFFSKRTIETLHKNINRAPMENLRVELAKLGSNAGFIGAACLILKEYDLLK